MLIVRMPAGRDAMRRYVCTVVLGDWLGLAWRMEQDTRSDVSICREGSPFELRIPDAFFSIPESDWLADDSLPTTPLTYWDGKGFENDGALVDLPLPLLYGANNSGIAQGERGVQLPFDVFGSIFFLLTGYEELASVERDSHGRFPASASLAMRADFIDRPLADEYAEILWLAMHRLWPQLKRRTVEPQILLSCDVDQPFDCSVASVPALLRACAGDMVKRRVPTAAMRRMLCFIYNRLGDYRFDPCYTFDTYLELCKEFDLRATFFFIPSSSEVNNGCYSITDIHIQRLMRKLSDAGHEIGMHGCYEAYLDAVQTENHYDQLSRVMAQVGVPHPLRSNRQHYLRWDSRITPSVLDQAGFKFDSSGGFADHAGFRYGTAREFQMWDWIGCKQLEIRQRPLVVMDCTLTHPDYMALGYGESAQSYIRKLIQKVRRYRGNFSALWHNDELSSNLGYLQLLQLLTSWRDDSNDNVKSYPRSGTDLLHRNTY